MFVGLRVHWAGLAACRTIMFFMASSGLYQDFSFSGLQPQLSRTSISVHPFLISLACVSHSGVRGLGFRGFRGLRVVRRHCKLPASWGLTSVGNNSGLGLKV